MPLNFQKSKQQKNICKKEGEVGKKGIYREECIKIDNSWQLSDISI